MVVVGGGAFFGRVRESRIGSRTRAAVPYDKGVELYERQQYGSALAEFKKALGAMSVDDAGYRMRARYYAALCAAERQQTGAAKCSNGLSRTIPIRST